MKLHDFRALDGPRGEGTPSAKLPGQMNRRSPALMAAIVVLASCPGTARDAPTEACTKVGETCKLGRGLLGVCTEAAPGVCNHEPCLVCAGQH